MDGLCSRPRPAAQRIAGRCLQYPQRMDGLCSIGWIAQQGYPGCHLQYPQRMDGLCSRAREIAYQRFHHLQYPQRMDGLCSWTFLLVISGVTILAVSSADGRALQLTYACRKISPSHCLAVSSADGRALQQVRGATWHFRQAITCSILSGWTGFAAWRPHVQLSPAETLAVSSADGRALQLTLLSTFQ